MASSPVLGLVVVSRKADGASKTGRQAAHGRCRCVVRTNERNTMSIGTILLIVLILILVGALPTWPHSRSWGYYPSGLLGLVLVVLIILLVMGRL